MEDYKREEQEDKNPLKKSARNRLKEKIIFF